MKFYCSAKEAVLEELHSDAAGLTQQEAEMRLEQNGKNRLEAAKGKSLLRQVFGTDCRSDDYHSFDCCLSSAVCWPWSKMIALRMSSLFLQWL